MQVIPGKSDIGTYDHKKNQYNLRIVGLDGETKVDRPFPTLRSLASGPDNSLLAFTSEAQLISLDERGEEVWSKDLRPQFSQAIRARSERALRRAEKTLMLSSPGGYSHNEALKTIDRLNKNLARPTQPENLKLSQVFGPYTLDDGSLLISMTYGPALRIDPKNGEVLDSFETLRGTPAYADDGTAFTMNYECNVEKRGPDGTDWEYSTLHKARLEDLQGSKALQAIEIGYGREGPVCTPDGEHIIYGGRNRIHCLDRDGNQLWERKLEGEGDVHLQRAEDGTLYAHNGKCLTAFTAEGHPLWKYSIAGSVTWMGDRVTIRDGKIHLLAHPKMVVLDGKSIHERLLQAKDSGQEPEIEFAEGIVSLGGFELDRN